MLYISLLLSAVLLAVVHQAVRNRWYLSETFAKGGLLAAGPIALGMFFPAVALQALLILAAAAVCAIPRWRPRAFVPLSYAVTAGAYAFVGWYTWQTLCELREEFPYASMEASVPPPKPAPAHLAPKAVAWLEDLEGFIADADPRPYSAGQVRTASLAQLHEGTVNTFVAQAGFGVGRMRSGFSREALTRGLEERKPVPQPEPASESAHSVGADPASPPRASADRPSLYWHYRSIADFAYPEGFGYLKDRRHVAGFLPHQFSKAPEPQQPWALRHLDLIGLVRHEKPVAYISANLPRMEELRKAPTRPLDEFENAGLKALRAGEDLFVAEAGDVRRMLGAVRSAKQCVDCHGGQRGDLLGSFSYTFRKVETP